MPARRPMIAVAVGALFVGACAGSDEADNTAPATAATTDTTAAPGTTEAIDTTAQTTVQPAPDADTTVETEPVADTTVSTEDEPSGGLSADARGLVDSAAAGSVDLVPADAQCLADTLPDTYAERMAATGWPGDDFQSLEEPEAPAEIASALDQCLSPESTSEMFGAAFAFLSPTGELTEEEASCLSEAMIDEYGGFAELESLEDDPDLEQRLTVVVESCGFEV